MLPKKLAEVPPNPLSNKEMEFRELAASMREQLLAVLGGSDGILGLSRAYNRANIEGIERILAIGTIDPLNALIADGRELPPKGF